MSSSTQPGSQTSSPYKTNFSLTSLYTDTFRFVALFPWTTDTLRCPDIAFSSSPQYKKAWSDLVAQWSNVVAIVSSNKVTFIRLLDNEPHQTILEIAEPPPSEEKGGLFTLAWSFDPVRLIPLVAFAGKSNLIYIWRLTCKDGVYDAKRLRVLKGHGEEIYALQFHLTSPHILASASRDTTVRIWNVLAREWPAATYRVPSMGMGDEGPVLVAILAGGTVGGHVEGVTALDFHPNLPCIVTGGADHTLKIWPLPPLPPPHPARNRHHPPHETFKCHHPLFSSGLIHSGIVNGVSWFNEDTLLSFADYPHSKVVKWKWLGLKHHFPLQPGGGRLIRYAESGRKKDALRVQRSEYDDSYSYHILTTYYPPSSPSHPRLQPVTSSFATSRCISPLQPSWSAYPHFHNPTAFRSIPSSNPNSPPPPLQFFIPLPPTRPMSSPGISIFHPEEAIPPNPNPPIPKLACAPENHDDETDESEENSAPITRTNHREYIVFSSRAEAISAASKAKELEEERERTSDINVFPRRKEDDENEAELRKWTGDAEGTTVWVLKANTVWEPPTYPSPAVEMEEESEDVEMTEMEVDSQELVRRNSPRKKRMEVPVGTEKVSGSGAGGSRVVKGNGKGRRIVSDDDGDEEKKKDQREKEAQRKGKGRVRIEGMRVRGVTVSGDEVGKWVVGFGERQVFVWRREMVD